MFAGAFKYKATGCPVCPLCACLYNAKYKYFVELTNTLPVEYKDKTVSHHWGNVLSLKSNFGLESSIFQTSCFVLIFQFDIIERMYPFNYVIYYLLDYIDILIEI